MPEKVLFTWSGGKDSAMALYELQKDRSYDVIGLLTTVTEEYDRISMHGVRVRLLEQQALSLDIPLEKVYITKDSSDKGYEDKMRERMTHYKKQGVLSVALGDIFLEELREYREKNLSVAGMKGLFPVWKRDTTELAQTFIDSGFKAVITCVDSNFLDGSFAGRIFDRRFLSELPPGVDPCGENGEFHSFVYDGPIFREKIPYKKGEVVLRDNRFYYCDLIPARS